MNVRSSHPVLVFLLAAFCALCSCGKRGNAQQVAPAPPAERGAGQPAEKLERISVAEIGKLRSRVGKEVIVFGKVAATSTSGSGHQFLNFAGGFKVVCLADAVGNFSGGGPAALFRDRLIEVRGEVATHQGKPQIAITSPDQVKLIELGGSPGGQVAAAKFELVEVVPGTWVSPAGLRYTGRDAQGLTRRAHVLRHAKDQPDRAGSHGVFDADGDAVFEVIDAAWSIVQAKNLRPQIEGDSQSYTVPMGRRVGYLGGKNGARQNRPALKTVFIVVRRGSKDVITAFPR